MLDPAFESDEGGEIGAAVLDGVREAVMLVDPGGTLLSWNRGAEHIFGWPGSAIVGRSVPRFLFVAPAEFDELVNLVRSEGNWQGELTQITQDRREIKVEARWSWRPERAGRAPTILIITRDVTELRSMELQLIRAQRMAGLGLLAGGIAHDLNNILTPIMLSIDTLKGTIDHPATRSVLETIEISARRGSGIVQQALSYARGMEGQRIEIQPRYLLQETEHIIRDTFPKNIRLKFSCPHDIWTISGDPTQLQQALLNLCVNARDAMPDGGSLTVGAKNHLVDEHYVAMNQEGRPGMYVVISVADSGAGIPESIVGQIFEPFFTTKEIGRGTGLGLSSLQTIVRSHDGFTHIYSEPGHGATFKVYLPACPETSPGALRRNEDPLPRGSGQLILVVDDEEPILAVTRQTLETFGYRYITAENGAEAVAVYAQRMDEIEVVLTDLGMPVMNGQATIFALRKINPRVRIVAMSGRDESESTLLASRSGISHFLAKPYSAAILLRTLQAALAG